MNNKFRIGIPQGPEVESTYEILFRAFANPEVFELFTPVFYGSERHVVQFRKTLGINVLYKVVGAASQAQDGHLNVVNLRTEKSTDEAAAEHAAATFAAAALDAAMADVRQGIVDAVVSLNDVSAALSAGRSDVFAILSSQQMRIVLPGLVPAAAAVTPAEAETSESAKAETASAKPETASAKPETSSAKAETASAKVDTASANVAPLALIEERIRQACAIARRDFLCSAPRVAVIAPAAPQPAEGETPAPSPLAELVGRLSNDDNLRVFGPYDQCTFFTEGHFKHFDCIVAADARHAASEFRASLHDDGHAYLAGLDVMASVLFAAPDATAEGLSRSLLQAVYRMVDVARCRASYDEATANPLPHVVQHDRREDRRNRREE